MSVLLLVQLVGRFHGFGRNLDGGFLVHTVTNVGHFQITLAHNVLGGVITVVINRVIGTLHGLQTTAQLVPNSEFLVLSSCGTDVCLNRIRIRVIIALVRLAGFGFQKQVATGQSVHEHIHESRKSHQRSCHSEIRPARGDMSRSCHTTSGQWKGQNEVHEGVNNHVYDDTV